MVSIHIQIGQIWKQDQIGRNVCEQILKQRYFADIRHHMAMQFKISQIIRFHIQCGNIAEEYFCGNLSMSDSEHRIA